jgi:serine/alanine adding enzyme
MNNMKILKNGEIDVESWQKLLIENQFASPFQSYEYYRFFNTISGLTSNVFALEENGELLTLCVVTLQKEGGIKGYFSRRAIIYGGPILIDGDAGKSALFELLKAINKDLKSNVIYGEIRNLYDYTGYKKCFESNGWDYKQHLNFHLDCSYEEIVWKNLNKNRQRQIKKAIKLGVQIEEAKSMLEVHEFYDILIELYKTKVKKPLFAFDFFEKLFNAKLSKFLLVKYKDKVIGGIVCPFLTDSIIYEFYVCGLDKEYKDASPSVMATYAAIEYGYKNGLKRFDFFGAGKPDEDYGVRDFKAKFGGELVEYGRFIKLYNRFLYNIGKTGLKLLQKLK